MGEIASNLDRDLKDAMRARNAVALAALRALKSALKNAAIEKGGAEAELTEAESVAVIRKQVKQRLDSIEQYQQAGRSELAAKEQAEIEILERYLPAPLSGTEIAAMVDDAVAETAASSKADMGKVMKILQERAAGRADGKTLSQAVMRRLG